MMVDIVSVICNFRFLIGKETSSRNHLPQQAEKPASRNKRGSIAIL